MANEIRRHVFVTGAGGGIGAAVAARFAHTGDSVTLCDLSPERALAVAKSLGDGKGNILHVSGDISRREDMSRMREEAESASGPVDILVNNAGIFPDGLVVNVTDSEWDSIMGVNLKGTFLATQTFVRGMIDRKKGWIVNLASVDGKTPGPGNSVYSASKAAVISFTQSMAREAAPYGVFVNAVAPGWVATPNVTKGERWKEAVKKIPLGRLAEPSEIADVIAFLCSKEARYIVGETINVNGGLFMD
ncbi:MAG: 3-oxoacyl-ACP reductase FabG [Synergistaceae bacterium]|nr:3-oxoacyl-ACP reductase FabG [Synergistaceae bacterium]